jgi:uncharacterized delta-60 repeat protein
MPVLAASVGPDPTFGVEGVAAPPLPAAAADAKAGIVDLAAVPDGGVYAALTGLGKPTYFGLVRLDEAGQPDPSFGTGGYSLPLADPAGPDSSAASSEYLPEAQAVAAQPDGRVVAVGSAVDRVYIREDGNTLDLSKALLARYLPDGSLDPVFGAGGSVTPEVSESVFRDVAVTPDGRILALGDAAYAFRPDGSLDRTFGERGRASINSRRLPFAIRPRAISLLPDGRFQVAGYLSSRLLLARLKADGRPDRSFGGGDGIVTVDIPNHRYRCCRRAAIALDLDGRTIVAVSGGASRERVFLARFGPAGGPDRTFGRGDGIVALPSPFAESLGVAVAPDGLVYVAGLAKPGGRPGRTFTYSIARIGPDGTLDRSFGRGGIETVVRGEQSIAGAALTLPDGRVLVGGSYVASAGDRKTQTTLLLTRFGLSG